MTLKPELAVVRETQSLKAEPETDAPSIAGQQVSFAPPVSLRSASLQQVSFAAPVSLRSTSLRSDTVRFPAPTLRSAPGTLRTEPVVRGVWFRVTPKAVPDPIVVLGWQTVEGHAATWMRRHGWEDAVVTPPGPDGGIDVTCATAVAQVKHWVRPVGIAEVQKIHRIAEASGRDALVFSTSGYTLTAKQWAADNGVRCHRLVHLDGFRSWFGGNKTEDLRRWGWVLVTGVPVASGAGKTRPARRSGRNR